MTATPTSVRARTVDGFVLAIAEAMLEGKWRAGKSNAEMAADKGVSVATVDEWASDAGRLLRLAPDVATITAVNVGRLDKVFAMALEKREVVHRRDQDPEIVDDPDLRAAVAAVAEQNKMVGAHAPEKHKYEHDVRIQTYAQMSPAETLEKVREQIAALQEVERELAARVGGAT